MELTVGLEQVEKLKDWLLEVVLDSKQSREATQSDADLLRRGEPTGPVFRMQIMSSS